MFGVELQEDHNAVQHAGCPGKISDILCNLQCEHDNLNFLQQFWLQGVARACDSITSR